MFIQEQWIAFTNDMKDWSEARKQKKSNLKKEKKTRAKKSKAEEEVIVPISEQPMIEDDAILKPEPIISSFAERAYPANHETQEPKTESKQPSNTEVEEQDEVVPIISFAEVENVSYELPSIDLLNFPRHTDQSGEYELIHANAAKLERTFQSFGVKARVTQVHLGPAVTKYEVHPDVGVKVSKIVSLSDDLALALAAKDIRIEAPIPGKSAIGIEVPNSEVAIVSLREVLESKQNNRPDAKLLIGLGRDITW